MLRTFGQRVLLLFFLVCAVQLFGTAWADECPRQWAASPLQAHEQMPGAADGQTDQGGELEELVFAQGEAFRIIHLARLCPLSSASCPRTDFVSDWFRPPALS